MKIVCIKKFLIAALVVITAGCATYMPPPAAIAIEEPSFSDDQLSADLAAFLDFFETTHPETAYTADLDEIAAKAASIRESLPETMPLRAAWMKMALLNPLFKDAHVGLRRPVAALAAYEENGGALFPAEVIVNDDGEVLFADDAFSASGFNSGDKILSINNVPAQEIFAALAPRMRGNSPALGRFVMSLYFPEYFWIAFGAYDAYVVTAEANGRRKTAPLAVASSSSNTNEENSPFSYKAIKDGVAYIEATTFDITQKARFETFLADAFAQIKQDNADTLIIDIRKNGGGAHDVSDLLMFYLTDTPFSSISGVTARVTEENIGLIPGASIGDVVSLPFQQMIEPPAEWANRFDGEVYVMISGSTYSQAIAFSTVIQDYNLGVIVGEETEGAANQTGQVQIKELPNTGIQALAPIYIFQRQSGDTSNRGVIPEIEIEHDPLDPDASLEQLLSMIEDAR